MLCWNERRPHGKSNNGAIGVQSDIGHQCRAAVLDSTPHLKNDSACSWRQRICLEYMHDVFPNSPATGLFICACGKSHAFGSLFELSSPCTARDSRAGFESLYG